MKNQRLPIKFELVKLKEGWTFGYLDTLGKRHLILSGMKTKIEAKNVIMEYLENAEIRHSE